MQRRIFLQCKVRPRLIVIGCIGGQYPPQMRLAKDQHFDQAPATQGADQTFRNAILPRRSRRDRPVADTHGFDPGRKDMPVGTVVVAYQISRD